MIISATITQSLFYILKNTGTCDKLKLIKLLYLADKYHLIRYGRTILNDDYYAMEYGPVGTTVKDILSFDYPINISKNEFEYLNKLIEKTGTYDYRAKNVDISLDMLSETDIEALDFIIKTFGDKESFELSEYTHKYPEWAQYEDLLKNGVTKRIHLRTEEFLSVLGDDDPIKMPDDHIDESRKILKSNTSYA